VRPVLNVCFYIRRKDGAEEAFSVSKCLGLDVPRSPLPSSRPRCMASVGSEAEAAP
jgi:Protein of unknown function (DUF3223)